MKTYIHLLSPITFILYGLMISGLLHAQTAEPSSENPFGHFGRAGVVPASKGMYDAVLKVEESLQDLTTKLVKDPAPSSKEMAKMYLLVGQLNRWVTFLDHYREPAAVDWRLRANFYLKALLEVRNRYYSTPPAAKAQVQVHKQLTNSQPARLKALGKTIQTLQSGELKQAENQIEKIQQEVLSISGVLQDPDKKPYYEPMNEVVGAVSGPMAKYRNRESAEAEQSEKRKLEELLETLQGTLANGSGAEGLAQASNQWRAVHLQRLRVHAFTNSGGSYGGSESVMTISDGMPGGGQSQDDGMASIKAAVVDYVTREANSTSSTSDVEQYLAIQQVLAELTLRADDSAWTTALERSLEALAKKCQLSSETYNYKLATDELLRWRQRTASEWADNQQGETLPVVARRELSSTDKYVGIYQKEQQTVLPLVLKALPDIVPDIQQKLMGKFVRTTTVVPIEGSNSAGWISRIDSGYYYNIAQNEIRGIVAPLLRKELLCAGSDRPLSLQAAAAILSADVGLCDEVGGTLSSFAIESYISRMCNLPESHSNAIALGTLGTELRGDSRRCLLLRCELKPSWIKHRYLIVSTKTQ